MDKFYYRTEYHQLTSEGETYDGWIARKRRIDSNNTTITSTPSISYPDFTSISSSYDYSSSDSSTSSSDSFSGGGGDFGGGGSDSSW